MFKRMSEFGPDSGGRVKVGNVSDANANADVYLQWSWMYAFIIIQGVTIVKPIVFGNVARYFGKKREDDGHTHQWTVFVKPYRNEVDSYLL